MIRISCEVQEDKTTRENVAMWKKLGNLGSPHQLASINIGKRGWLDRNLWCPLSSFTCLSTRINSVMSNKNTRRGHDWRPVEPKRLRKYLSFRKSVLLVTKHERWNRCGSPVAFVQMISSSYVDDACLMETNNETRKLY
jgi:hypothetical protein